MNHKTLLFLSLVFLTTSCTENMISQDSNPKTETCDEHSCAQWTTCIQEDGHPPQCVIDSDGDTIADVKDPCPYTTHQDGNECFYVIDGVYRIYTAHNLMILHDMANSQSIHTIELKRDINMGDLQMSENQDKCFITAWDNKKLNLSNITLKGNHHKISSFNTKSNTRCGLTNALFDKIKDSTISKLTLDFDVEDIDSERMQAFALLANAVDKSELNDIMYSGKVVSNSRAYINIIKNDSDTVTAIGGLAGVCENSTINDCFSKHTSVTADYAMGVGGLFGYSSNNSIYVTNPQKNCDDNLFILDHIRGGYGVGGLFGFSVNTSINDFPGGPSDEIPCGKYFNIVFDTIEGLGVGGIAGVTLSNAQTEDDPKEKNYLSYIFMAGNNIFRQDALLRDVLKRYSEDDDEYLSFTVLFMLGGGAGGWIGLSSGDQTIVEHAALHVSQISSPVANPNNVPFQTIYSPIGGFIGAIFSNVILDSIVSTIDTMNGNYVILTGGLLGTIQLNSGFTLFGASNSNASVQLSKITSTIDLMEGFNRSGIILSDETQIDDNDDYTSGLFNANRKAIIKLDHISSWNHIQSYGTQNSNYAGLFIIDNPADNMDFNYTFNSVVTATNRYLNSKSVSNHAVSMVLPSDLTCKESSTDDEPLDNSDCLKGIYYYANHADDKAFSDESSPFMIQKVYGSNTDDTIHDLNRDLSKAHDCVDRCTEWYWKPNAFQDRVNMQPINLPYLYQPELEDGLLRLSQKHCDIFNDSPFCKSQASE